MPKSRPVALITGASAGIGRAFAEALADRGYDLVVVARDAARLEELGEMLKTKHSTSVEVLPADLTADEGLMLVEDRLKREDAPIDLLVNNAGFGTAGRFHEISIDKEIRMVDLNISALVRLTHAALDRMVARGCGGIINVSSVAAFQPAPGNATYSATKAFVSSFTQAVHEEVRARGVRIMAVNPGFTRTEFQQRAGMEAEKVPGFMWQQPEDVVAVALKAFDNRRAVIIPGIINKMTATFSSVAPGVVTRKIAGRIMKDPGAARLPRK